MQRLFGELHVEGFEVSHTKDGFKWHELEHTMLERLHDALESEPINLLRQAEQRRARLTRAVVQPAAKQATASVTAALENSAGPVLSTEPAPPALERVVPSTPARLAADPVAQRAVDILVDDSRWTINLRMTIEPKVEDWLRFADETIPQLFNEHDEHRLTVDVSLAHPSSSASSARTTRTLNSSCASLQPSQWRWRACSAEASPPPRRCTI